MSAPRWSVRAAAFAALFVLLASASTLPAGKDDFKFAPGPSTISEEEKAIAPDPNRGMEHGVVLLEEFERDERLGSATEIRFHLRAKILSNEGRHLGDVEIPFNDKTGQLKQWWGKVLCPDGTFGALKQDELKRQFVSKEGKDSEEVLKGSLPGVGPGCVIDYGYDYWSDRVYRMTRMYLQGEWPIRDLRYRWLTYQGLSASYRMTQVGDLDINAAREGRQGILVVAKNLPAVVTEPYMPAVGVTRAVATTYYTDPDANLKDFWNSEAKKLDRRAAAFTSEKSAMTAIAAMGLPESADLPAKLRAAYDWIGSGIKDRVLMTSEEEDQEETADQKTGKKKDDDFVESGADLLQRKEGYSWQIAYLYLAVARALGAEADVVRAANRSEHFWDTQLFTLYQFDWTLVAVRAPGEPDEKAVVVAPGSGLPYGQVPWWLTGTNAWLATAKGGREIKLYASDLQANLMESKARLGFDEGGSLRASWSQVKKGQQGYATWTRLRDMTPEDRAKELDRLCGAGAAYEVTKAAGPDLTRPVVDYRLECELEGTDAGPQDGSGTYSFSFDGPWDGRTPSFTANTRVHPVVFDYPFVDRSSMDVESPRGYAPVAAPQPITVEERFARYTLTVTATPGGYHVEREHQFAPLLIMPADYPGLRDYLAEVHRADRIRLEFKRTAEKP